MSRRGGVPREMNGGGVPVCRRGHIMTEANTYNRPGTSNNPQCRECRRLLSNTDDYTRPEEGR